MRRLTPAARGVLLTIVLLLAVSWTLMALVLVPSEASLGTTTAGVGMAVTAFLLGVRHAFDADHIAAIDNTSRKLTDDGKDPSGVGLWFALGHSTVVVVAVGLVTAGVGALTSQLGSEESPLAAVTGVWGPTVSSVFLLAMAAVNLVILAGLIRGRSARHTAGTGPVSLLIGRLSATLDAPWKLFIVGLLFGLGFDTASTIAILVLAGGAGAALPWQAAMVVPLLFAAGMAACDGLNSIVTARIYRWSTDRPGRRRRYNIALMSISITVALVVGVVGMCGVLVDVVGVGWAPARAVAATDLDVFGFVIVAVLLLAWAVSWAMSRRRRDVSFG
ncbi:MULTISPECIES: HoxN/HupN/NixA family nickel/cobalt transporter [Microbacterium]|uniref:HoxN/HupN/NixA family nickel/cobalt transporter n=1 Tax=Microbacterium TaxID=33882 RepID=UPI002784DBB4|nr:MULTISPECIES: HoxN/HupN/NixA family nickel/cobalt transporter [Microbacterium]MDQ1082758.1 high-affinity nickel-transport protein [Microbacterium sp. SORGH_AS_0344]MDQ1168472.1 high-affinity nickel-transport protein [Microbacterium proteolyticum]